MFAGKLRVYFHHLNWMTQIIIKIKITIDFHCLQWNFNALDSFEICSTRFFNRRNMPFRCDFFLFFYKFDVIEIVFECPFIVGVVSYRFIIEGSDYYHYSLFAHPTSLSLSIFFAFHSLVTLCTSVCVCTDFNIPNRNWLFVQHDQYFFRRSCCV